MERILKMTKVVCAILAFLMFSLAGLEKVKAENLSFRIVVVNPSKTKSQTTEVKRYLPVEVKPKDILDLAGLTLEYDTQSSLYYAYKKEVELQPAEVKVFELEIKDVWLVPEENIADLRNRTDSILAKLEDTEYYFKAKEIADTIYPRLTEIETSQSDDSVGRDRHIGIYRQNLEALDRIKEDMQRLEKILVTAGGPPSPEMLANSRIKADSPSETMTWIVIFIIIIFIGLLTTVLFFTWQHQSRITTDTLAQSKKSAFPELDSEKEAPKEGEQK